MDTLQFKNLFDCRKLLTWSAYTLGHHSLTRLDVDYNVMNAECIHVIAAKCPSLKVLSMRHNVLCSTNCVEDIPSARFANLRVLDLARNFIGDEGLRILSVIMMRSLTSLELQDNRIQSILPLVSMIGVGGLADLEYLGLSDNQLTDKTVCPILECVQLSPIHRLTHLQRLDLARNSLRDFVMAIKHVQSLGGLGALRFLDVTQQSDDYSTSAPLSFLCKW